ncbi:glycine-rich domain-containing protein [Methylobacterium thuringiense]|uniref:Glycine-rich domain-containing protein n=1 Tax=Methylobacterium thuringiense TaxID=1003091 RepID=A0ABQ4TK07_9HYPH|nr:hypothetical protein [Methylobacterium thuringiense]GJE54589.1 hypothetical protein EKPJFOCH_1067 [Methylobacterium thuringiense]
MANIDLLGPASAPGAVTARPSETRVFGQNETWFAPCTSQSSRDGTQLQAVFQNGLLAQVRYALKASGITLDNADDAMLWKAILAAVAAGAPPPTALWHTGDDTSNAAGTIVASVIPTITAHGRYWYGIKVAQTCPGPTQAVINGLPSRTVVRGDGAALKQGDYLAGQELILSDDGTRLQVVGLVLSQVGAGSATYINSLFIPGGRPKQYLTPGSYSLSIPASRTFLVRECRGSGGGGGGASTNMAAASGGGGGGNAQKVATTTADTVLTIVVGAGGAGGAGGGSPQNGLAGGTTSVTVASGSVVDANGTTFGAGQTLCAATGGTGGIASTSGSGGINGGLGGVASGGDINDSGDGGGLGYPITSTAYLGGLGGASPGSGGTPTVNYSAAGNSSTAPGIGGNGSSGNAAGGFGSPGRVTLTV